MVGFILGAVFVVGLTKMLRRRAWHGGCGGHFYGPPPSSSSPGFGGFGGFGRFGGFGHGGPGMGRGMRSSGGWPRGGGWALRSVFERLETTPGQARVIMAALDELRENRRDLREELRQARADIARAIQGGLIEDNTLEEAFARQDRLLARIRVGFTEALKKVVETLDEPQRKQLASWLEGGGFFRAGGWGDGGQVWA
jgi:hypothetical protein